jgi:hypothetical protein
LSIGDDAAGPFSLDVKALGRELGLKLLPRLRLREDVAGLGLYLLAERHFPRPVEAPQLPVRNPAALLALFFAHHVPGADPPSLLLDLPQRIHVFQPLEAVAPQLPRPWMHAVHRCVNVRVMLVSMDRQNRLVLPEAAPLKKLLHVLQHLLVGDLLLRVIPDRDRVHRLLHPLPQVGRDLHLSGRLLRVLLVEDVARLHLRSSPLLSDIPY